MELAQLIANAPWREAVTHRETWPHEYVLTSKDGQQELLAAARFRTYQIVTGNPDTVIKKLKHVIDIVDPSSLVLWGREGPMSHDTAVRCIDLLGQEVIPAIKEYESQQGR